jgi:hypothetical protein
VCARRAASGYRFRTTVITILRDFELVNTAGLLLLNFTIRVCRP